MPSLRCASWCLPLLLTSCHDDAGVSGGNGSSGAGTSEGSESGSGGSSYTTGLADGGGSSSGTPGSSSSGAAPDLPPPSCAPDGGGPWWLLEGDPLSVAIRCGTGVGDDAGFELAPLPDGASFDDAAATLSWTPALDQGAVYDLTITSRATGETAALRIGVADRWDDPANVPVVDPTTYTFEFGLPVLHLQTDPAIGPDAYTPATTTYRGHVYTNEAKTRGAASLWYPKQSYTLKFTKDDKFDEPEFAGGFHDKRKLVLISTFDDNAYVRQRLAYELWNTLDAGHLQIQVYSAVVFKDGEYWGLYTVADHVDGYFMEDQGYLQTGNLYKARTHDANFRLAGKGTPHQGLTKEEGYPPAGQPGAFDDLDALVTFVDSSSNAAFDAQIDDWIDRRDYEDWYIFVTLIMADDSAGKNSYHYHDPAGGPFRYAPWDFNDSFGQTWQTLRKGYQTHPEDYTWANELFVRLLDSASFGQPLRTRYDATLHGAYDLDAVLERYDAMVDETAASALRDEGRWGEQYRSYGGWNWRDDFTSYDQEVEYVRQWIIDRWGWVDGVY
jgi:hypothetical protein